MKWGILPCYAVAMSAIQWFPGHMNKARQQVAAGMRDTDVVIEVIDARLPRASTNPMIAELRTFERGDGPVTVPVVRLLNKIDLADQDITQAWVSHLRAPDVHGRQDTVLYGRATEVRDTARIVQACKRLAPHRTQADRPVRVMVQGVPNCGKSTLINTLKGRKVAKTGDEPAVTRHLQRVQLPSGLVLHDTPGLMWPKVEDPLQGWLLAMSGTVRDTAVDVASVGQFAAGWLWAHARDNLVGRFKACGKLADSVDNLEVLEAAGRSRGCLASGGAIDHDKAARALLGDLRSGRLGRISFEKPDTLQAAPLPEMAKEPPPAAEGWGR